MVKISRLQQVAEEFEARELSMDGCERGRDFVDVESG